MLFRSCTGDVHIGNKVSADGLHHVGQENFKADVARVVATFTDMEQVVLTGSSAGGFGAMYNYFLVADAYAGTETTMIDDSGPFFPLSVTPNLVALRTLFDLPSTVAPGCDKCLDLNDADGGLHQLIPYYASSYPGHRISLISSLEDRTIAGNFSITGKIGRAHV